MLFELPDHDTLYTALCQRDTNYDGTAYVCVKTTQIFCRLTCPARKPKSQNCIFLQTVAECIGSGFRPCKRCKPLAPEAQADATIQLLLAKLDTEPCKRWSEADIKQLGLDPGTVRRSFKRQYGITFLEMARHARMRESTRELANGARIIDAQVTAGYASASAFRSAFSSLLGMTPAQFSDQAPLKAAWLQTPLGPMICVADDERLHLLEFTERKALPRELKNLCNVYRHLSSPLGFGSTSITDQVKGELENYFSVRCADFSVPLAMHSTAFTHTVWDALRTIPAGQTRSYSEVARAVGRPAAVRAVARANGANPIAIIVPCHRVLGADGSLTGYGGGLWRKQKLLELEQQYANNRK